VVDYGLKADGTYGPRTAAEAAIQQEKAEKLRLAGDAGELPMISLKEFRKHTDENSLWVAYNGAVYDVTNFVAEHPGGKWSLLSAGGQDLEGLWEKYTIHYRKDVMSSLEPYRIGTLSDSDAAALKDPSNKENAVHQRPGEIEAAAVGFTDPAGAKRDSSRLTSRTISLWSMSMTASLWWGLRTILRLMGVLFPVVGPYVASKLASLLPCAALGFVCHGT